jgi:predicted alpha/beta hydrolase family esterase
MLNFWISKIFMVNMKTSNVILLHGIWPEEFDGVPIADIPSCNPNNAVNWMGWVKKDLEERGYSVACPIIPDTWNASYADWKNQLDKVTINEDTILVGLSGGAYAILRYLGESGKEVKKVILVAPGAPGFRSKGGQFPHVDEFYSYEITSKLQDQIKQQVVIFVSNDDEFILQSVEFYKNTLDARVIEIKDMGHFSFLIPQFPELLEEIMF